MKGFVTRTLLLTTAVMAGVTSQAAAQTSAPAEKSAAAQDSSGIEDIVVTAQRREERLQDVPIAVSAVSASDLAKRGVQSSTDLAVAVPSLNMSRGIGAVLPFLRGVGNSSSSVGNDPSVAIYVDGVYQSYQPAALFSFNNIERVEVLKGPQGTLFGRNATGGLINVITSDPSPGFAVKGSVGFANYQTVSNNLYVTGGNDFITADLAVLYTHQNNGWGRNLFTPTQATPTGTIANSQGVVVAIPTVDPEVGKNREFAVRGKILITPTDTTRITLSGDYFKQTGDQGMYRSVLEGSVVSPDPTGTTAQQDVARPFRHQGGFYDYNSDVAWVNRTRVLGGSAKIEQELGDVRAMSLTSYRDNDGFQYVVAEVTPIISQTNSQINARIKTFTQELQLLSNGKGRLQWILGGFYMHSKAAQDPIEFVRGPIEPTFARYSQQTTKSISGFGQATYEVLDDTKVTLGLRYTSDRVEAEGYDIGRRVGAAPSPAFAVGVISQSVAPQAAKFDKLTWRLSLDHKFTPGVMAYASYSRGFKAGVFNTSGLCQSASVTAGLVNTNCLAVSPPVAPEVLDAYEVGIKSDLFGRKLRLNISAFYYDYTNLQVQSVVDNGSGIPVVVATNAAAAKVYGVDLEGSFAPTSRLRFDFGTSVLNATYKDYPNAVVFLPNATAAFPNRPNNTQITLANAAGNRLNRAPDFVGSFAATYTIPTSEGDFTLNGSYYYNDGFYWEQANRLRQESYSLVNAQIGWRSTDGHYGFMLWGRNLTKTKYYAFQQASGTSGDQGAPAAPRTYGATLTFSF